MASRLSLLFAPVRLAPAPLQAGILTLLVNHILRGQTLVDRLQELNGRSVTVCVTDIPWQMHFRIKNKRVQAVVANTEIDVTISGKLHEYIQLLSGNEDPDTLFFQRRLNMEGDTETGVHIKNLLDSLEYDWDAHFDSFLAPALAVQAKRLQRKIAPHIPYELLARMSKDKVKAQGADEKQGQGS